MNRLEKLSQEAVVNIVPVHAHRSRLGLVERLRRMFEERL